MNPSNSSGGAETQALPSAMPVDDCEQVLLLYRALQELDRRLNRVLDTVAGQESAGHAAPLLEELSCEMEQIKLEIERMPVDTHEPEHRARRFELMLHDEYHTLTIYLIDCNLRRIKDLGIRSEAFDNAIRSLLHPLWPRLPVQPIDLVENLAVSARLRDRERQACHH